MSEQVLELDLGNTAIKWRVLESGDRLCGGRLNDLVALSSLLEDLSNISLARVASVASEARNEQLVQCLARSGVEARFARTQQQCGALRNSYREYSRMGVDRWLAMVAAYRRCGGACLVADVGTALTIDIVDVSGQHRGGYILPGPMMMAEALVGGTDRVRVEGDESPAIVPGVSTEQCVHNAKWLATLASVREAAQWARQEVGSSLAVLVTGGAGRVLCELAGQAGGEWLYIEELVLDGLIDVVDP